MKTKLNIRRLILFFYALCTYFNIYFYMTWSTYPNQFLSSIINLLPYAGCLALLLLLLVEKRKSGLTQTTVLAIMILVLFEIHVNILGKNFGMGLSIYELRFVACTIVLLLIAHEDRVVIFEYMLKIFVIMILPSIIYYLLSRMGVNIPHSILQSTHEGKRSTGTYYAHYPFGLILKSLYIKQERLAAVFDEPGVVGTLAALFFAGGYGRIQKKWMIPLVIGGVLSSSLAFYLLIAAYFLIRAYLGGARKFVAIVLVFVCVFLVFLNVDFGNPMLSQLQDRIDLTSRILFSDNRTDDMFENEFSKFVEEGGYPLIMGYGNGASSSNPRLNGSSSYKMLVYDYGIVGVGLFLALYCMLAKAISGINKKNIGFLAVFLLSIYQRPFVMNIQYVTLLITAVTYIRYVPWQLKGME